MGNFLPPRSAPSSGWTANSFPRWAGQHNPSWGWTWRARRRRHCLSALQLLSLVASWSIFITVWRCCFFFLRFLKASVRSVLNFFSQLYSCPQLDWIILVSLVAFHFSIHLEITRRRRWLSCAYGPILGKRSVQRLLLTCKYLKL